MAGFNQWTGLGNLGQDAELKRTRDGTAVLNFSLACSETWKDSNGQKKEKTEWVRCVMFGKRAPSLAAYLNKGTKLLVTGKLTTSTYEDREGVKRYKTEVRVEEVVFAGGGKTGKGRASKSEDTGGAGDAYEDNGQYSAHDYGGDDPDDDIPFSFCEFGTRERWWRW